MSRGIPSPVRWVASAFLLIVVTLGGSGAVAHPVHATLAEVEWNPKAREYEVALQMQVVDVERALVAKRAASGRNTKIRLTEDERTLSEVLDVVDESFFAEARSLNRPIRLEAKGVGLEIGPKVMWLYFTWTHGGEMLSHIENRLFLGHSKTHINTVVVTKRSRKASGSDPVTKIARSHVFQRKAPGPWNVIQAFSMVPVSKKQ